MDRHATPEGTAERARRGRGRPRAFDRDAALLAATHLFWRKGYAATSISDLTEAIGIGSPSLYAAFRSKEALYAEAIHTYGERYGPEIWSNFLAAATAREAIRALLMDSAAMLPRGRELGGRPGCMVMLSTVGDEGCAELGALVRAGRAAGRERIEARLVRARKDGELPTSVDVAGLARFVVAVQGGMSILARDGADRKELEAAARTAMAGWTAMVGD